MSDIRATGSASLVAAFVPTLWFVWFQTTSDHAFLSGTVGILGFSLFFYAYSAGIAFVFGGLSISFLRRLGLVRWWMAILVGAGLGLLLLHAFGNRPIVVSPASVTWAAIGAVTGLVFWSAWSHVTRQG